MRIIITNDGIKEIKQSFAENPKPSPKKEIINCPHWHSRSRANLHSVAKTNNFNQQEGYDSMSLSNIDSINNFRSSIYKTISIKQKKLSIPLNKSVLYDVGKEDPGHIIKQMPEVLSRMKSSNSVSSYTLPKLKQSYSLQELISPESFKNLEAKLKNTQQVALNNRKTDESIFRNDKTGREIFKQLNDCKKSTISADNTSMIEYLLGKTTISDSFVKNIASYEKNRIDRLNKISQRMLMRKEREKVLKKEIQSKINSYKAEERNKYKKEIESIEDNIMSIKKIVDVDYPTSMKDKRIFKFLHSEMIANYWKGNKYDRYYYNSHLRENKPCHSNVSSRSIKYFKKALPSLIKNEES